MKPGSNSRLVESDVRLDYLVFRTSFNTFLFYFSNLCTNLIFPSSDEKFPLSSKSVDHLRNEYHWIARSHPFLLGRTPPSSIQLFPSNLIITSDEAAATSPAICGPYHKIQALDDTCVRCAFYHAYYFCSEMCFCKFKT